MINAQNKYPVYQQYAEEEAFWQEVIKTLPPEQAERLQTLLGASQAWEARFLMMSDKYMAQTDYLGLCSGRFKTIQEWGDQAKKAAASEGTP